MFKGPRSFCDATVLAVISSHTWEARRSRSQASSSSVLAVHSQGVAVGQLVPALQQSAAGVVRTSACSSNHVCTLAAITLVFQRSLLLL